MPLAANPHVRRLRTSQMFPLSVCSSTNTIGVSSAPGTKRSTTSGRLSIQRQNTESAGVRGSRVGQLLDAGAQ